jgi:phenylpropionate dioxygenase-like ring-hydroxylating dioxygenase large terminal subunit
MADRDALHPPARCPGPGVDELFDADSRPVPELYRQDSWQDRGSAPLSAARYTSPEFFAAERERMWPRVWQMAAREEEFPEAGDTVVYANLGRSVLLVRQPDLSIKAFWNVCLHRGRLLRTESGPASELECPFHGFTWALDGGLKRIPCQWDFPHLTPEKMALPEVRAESWAGYVFINWDGNAPPLSDYLAPLPAHFERWRMAENYTGLWVGKVIKANWKAVSEAFMEAWHSVVTHPQILAFTGDANTRYSLWGDHVNLALTPFGVLSPHLAEQGLTDAATVEAFAAGSRMQGMEPMQLAPGQTARSGLADKNRAANLTALGHDAADATDSEVLDAWTYNVFPNIAPWGGFGPNISYRWRPWPDQDATLMEVRLLFPTPAGQPKPRAAEMRFLGEDEPWATVTDWGALGSVFDQDMANLPYVQEGLKSSANDRVELGNYQESRIRHFHATLDKYLAGEI